MREIIEYEGDEDVVGFVGGGVGFSGEESILGLDADGIALILGCEGGVSGGGFGGVVAGVLGAEPG